MTQPAPQTTSATSARASTTLQGSIDSFPVRDLLALLSSARRSGRLVLRPSQPLWLEVREGRVAAAGASSPMTLGRYLLARGVVSAEQLESWFSLSDVAAGISTLHALDVYATLVTLAGSGEVPLAELYGASLDSCGATVADMLALGDAVGDTSSVVGDAANVAFVFTESDSAMPSTDGGLEMSEVLAEADRQRDVVAQAQPRLGGLDQRFRRRSRISAPVTPLTLQAHEWAALAEIDDRSTIAQLSHRLGLGFASTYEVIDRFIELGLIEPA